MMQGKLIPNQHDIWTFFKYLLIICSFLLFSFGVCLYNDSKLIYCVFSLCFLTLLATSLIDVRTYSYTFLAIFLWLGFWVKLNLHLIFNYPYHEATGFFFRANHSYDQILIISSMGCLGILLARFFFQFLNCKSIFIKTIYIPIKKNNLLLDVLIFSTMILLPLLNIKLQLFQIGLVPKTILIWPFNALFAWVLNFGFIITINILFWREIQQKNTKRLILLYMFILTEATLFSISIISRILYILHVVPIITVFIFNNEKFKFLNKKIIVCLLSLTVMFFLVSLKEVTTLRSHFYVSQNEVSLSKEPINEEASDIDPLDKNFYPPPVLQKTITQVFFLLVVDRWLGLEGVMAVGSYPHKNMELLTTSLFHKPRLGEVDIYQHISKSQYRQKTSNFIFGTLPGIIAFLFYSGYGFIVFLGMLFITFLMMCSEISVYYLTKNNFLCSIFGMSLAYTLEQFNGSIGNILKYYCLGFGYFFVIFILNNYKLYKTKILPKRILKVLRYS